MDLREVENLRCDNLKGLLDQKTLGTHWQPEIPAGIQFVILI